MSEINEDLDRQVVPRWRSSAATAKLGELSALRPNPPTHFAPELLTDILEDWSRNPGLSVAADLVSAAFVIGCPSVARDAARFVLADNRAPTAARELAKRALDEAETGPTEPLPDMPIQPQPSQLPGLIHHARERLRVHPINPVMWTNLALLFTVMGGRRKAQRAMRSALTLAPGNRFVVRAASRLFLHEGDRELAHHVLLSAPALKRDPWILASEIAVASTRKKTSEFIKLARKFLETERYSPFHLSELASALATLEAHAGNMKVARRHCRLSLTQPTENAIAQAAWLDRNSGGILSCHVAEAGELHSPEASAWFAARNGSWNSALDQAHQWQADQPFSSRPAILGSYIASTGLEDYDEAARIAERGLRSNWTDATLRNNLAFAHARAGKITEASQVLSQLKDSMIDARSRICLTATRGLIAFRSGNLVAGRELYRDAIEMAAGEPLLRSIAKIYRAIEEVRVGSETAQVLRAEAIDVASGLPSPLNRVFRDKLNKAKAADVRALDSR